MLYFRDGKGGESQTICWMIHSFRYSQKKILHETGELHAHMQASKM